MVIPGQRLAECSQILASHFREVRTYRLTEPASVRYKQIVVMARRRNRRERERLQDSDITRARLQYATLAREPSPLPALSSEPDFEYPVPESGPVQLIYRGLPLDPIEDLLPKSAAYSQASRILFAPPNKIYGRPLTPLHAGHTGLLAVRLYARWDIRFRSDAACSILAVRESRRSLGRSGRRWDYHSA